MNRKISNGFKREYFFSALKPDEEGKNYSFDGFEIFPPPVSRYKRLIRITGEDFLRAYAQITAEGICISSQTSPCSEREEVDLVGLDFLYNSSFITMKSLFKTKRKRDAEDASFATIRITAETEEKLNSTAGRLNLPLETRVELPPAA